MMTLVVHRVSKRVGTRGLKKAVQVVIKVEAQIRFGVCPHELHQLFEVQYLLSIELHKLQICHQLIAIIYLMHQHMR